METSILFKIIFIFKRKKNRRILILIGRIVDLQCWVSFRYYELKLLEHEDEDGWFRFLGTSPSRCARSSPSRYSNT